MKLINMKMSAEEASGYSGGSVMADVPKYPYGLQICLDDDALEKVGLYKDLPRVGESFMVLCKVDVVGVNERESMGGEVESSVNLQITDMAIEKPFESNDAENKLYGA